MHLPAKGQTEKKHGQNGQIYAWKKQSFCQTAAGKCILSLWHEHAERSARFAQAACCSASISPVLKPLPLRQFQYPLRYGLT
ncbi:hypothetical protein EOV40_012065 [Acetobacter oryzoeni]|uniref:Uncharacterized protein n=1 Tax=Acetobacter oryzoeni TaxID=2500548 RepID=A0A5B9GM28_9PROT|nr:hypothetical protein EOV40_012065 [Acetobacter oryzoeni]